jgi:hypothetical protein
MCCLTVECGLNFYLPSTWLVFITILIMCWVNFEFTICVEKSQNDVNQLRDCINTFFDRGFVSIITSVIASVNTVTFVSLYIGLRRKEARITSLALMSINEM